MPRTSSTRGPGSSGSPGEPQASARAGEQAARATRHGAGRVLIAVYAVFALSATARAGYQIATQFSRAPVAYLLSALAAVVYVVATVALGRATLRSRQVATGAVVVELLGVLSVGVLSLTDTAAFPDATVWSDFGAGYGYVPLVLPVLGLLWLRRSSPARRAAAG